MGFAGGPSEPREDGFYIKGFMPGVLVAPGDVPKEPGAQAVEYRGGKCVWKGPIHRGSRLQREAAARADIKARKDEQRRGDVAEQTAIEVLTGLVMQAYGRVTGESTETSETARILHDAVKAALSSEEARSAFKLWNVEG